MPGCVEDIIMKVAIKLGGMAGGSVCNNGIVPLFNKPFSRNKKTRT